MVNGPFQRLINEGQLIGYPYDGFWTAMDKFKDKQRLENLWGSGAAPWEVWKANRAKPTGSEAAVLSETRCVP